MIRKSPKRPRKRKKDSVSRPPPPPPEPETLIYETSIGDFVHHQSDPPYIKFYLFRPDHDQTVAELEARAEAGEEIDAEEWWWRTVRFGELMLAHDGDGLTAELYLDRKVVSEDEVETLIDGACEFLENLSIGPPGGVLGVYWMEEIADYSLDGSQ